MKRIFSLLLALALMAGLAIPAAGADAPSSFTDIQPDDFYYAAVRQAYEWGLMSGVSADTFAPDAAISRGVFLTGLGRVAGLYTGSFSGGSGFSDVAAGDPLAPYTAWALEHGISGGVGGGKFAPDAALTQRQLCDMVSRFLSDCSQKLPQLAASAEYSALMRESAPYGARIALLGQYVTLPAENPQPEALVPRYQAAMVYVWLNRLRWGGDMPVVNDWEDYVSLEDAVPAVENPVVSAESIVSWAESYGLSADSPAFQALCAINTEYADALSQADRAAPLVFLFEGAGANANPGVRMNAMCVVVSQGEIVYLNRNSSTIPDDPFDPGKNDGMDMPTLTSGIYTYSSTNQGYYAALHVEGAQVVRFRSSADYYPSTSVGINIHRRNQNEIAPDSANWGNSVGCCLIGFSGAQPGGEYADFIEAVGLVPAGSRGDVSYSYEVSGKVIVDRSLAGEYLQNVGYPQEAIDLIG